MYPKNDRGPPFVKVLIVVGGKPFSKEIAHEVKNPLSIILFDLELIKESICQIDIDKAKKYK